MKSPALLLIAAVMAALGLFLQYLHDSQGPPAQRVNIRWAPGVSSEERLRIQQEAHLTSALQEQERTWSYLLADRSRDNIGRLLRNPGVEDTFHIDVQSLTVALDRPELPPWLRALLQTDQAGTIGLGVMLLALVVSAVNWRLFVAIAVAVARTAERELRIDPPFTDRRRRVALVSTAVLTLIVLILTVDSQLFDSNFFAMTGAQSILSGDLPFRDYFDPGVPLAAFTAAAMQLLTGPRLIGEFLRQWAFIVGGVVLACHLGLQLSRSAAAVLLTLPVTLFLVANEPTYHYAKLFFFPLMIWAGWRYLDRPGPLRAGVMGVVSATAFLERHDFGIYLGFASVVALLLAPAAAQASRVPRALFRDAGSYGAGVLTLVAPWAVVVQRSEGLLSYARARSELYQGSHPIYASLFRLEVLRDLIHWGTPTRDLVAEWLQRMVLLVPVALIVSAVIGVVRASRQAEPIPAHVWKRLFAGIFLAALGEALIRQATYVVVILPVTAALASVFVVSPSKMARVLTGTLVAISTLLQGMVIAKTPIADPSRYLKDMTSAFRRLTQSPPGYRGEPFEYLRRCTAPADHILVAGNNPLHVSYFSQRPIAGGQINWHRGWMSDPEHERLALRLLERQSVPIVVSYAVPAMSDFAAYPNIAAYLRAHYREVEGTEGQILVDVRRQPTGRYEPDGYPCFN